MLKLYARLMLWLYPVLNSIIPKTEMAFAILVVIFLWNNLSFWHFENDAGNMIYLIWDFLKTPWFWAIAGINIASKELLHIGITHPCPYPKLTRGQLYDWSCFFTGILVSGLGLSFGIAALFS